MIEKIPFTKSHLENLRNQMRNSNVFPVFLEQMLEYESRTDYPIRLALKPLLEEVTKNLQNFSPADLESIRQDLHWYWKDQIDKAKLSAYDEETLAKTALYIVIHVINESYTDFRPYLAGNDWSNSYIKKAHPELDLWYDDDKLLRLAAPGLRANNQAIYYADEVLHYHQFLRRGYSSNPNFDFLKLLTDYSLAHPKQRGL